MQTSLFCPIVPLFTLGVNLFLYILKEEHELFWSDK